MLVNWGDPGVPHRALAAAWDRSPNELVWSSDSKTLYATAQDVGQQSLFAIDVASGAAKPLLAKGTVSAPARLTTGAADAVAVLVDDLRSPAEVHIVSTAASATAPVARTSASTRIASPPPPWAMPSSSRSRAGTTRPCTVTW